MRPGETISSTQFERRAGGKGANQAAAVARAGGIVSLVGAVGEDGIWVTRDLEAMGVDVTNVSVVQVCPAPGRHLSQGFEDAERVFSFILADDNRFQKPTGRAVIQLTPTGENCISEPPNISPDTLDVGPLISYTSPPQRSQLCPPRPSKRRHARIHHASATPE